LVVGDTTALIAAQKETAAPFRNIFHNKKLAV